jgi:hypothetical protein
MSKNWLYICRPIAGERVDKHISLETDSWKPTRYGTRFLGYGNEICFHGDRFLETNMSQCDKQMCPWIWICYIRGRLAQNEVSCSSDQKRERSDQNRAEDLLWVIVNVWLQVIVKVWSVIPIQTQLLLLTAKIRDNTNSN